MLWFIANTQAAAGGKHRTTVLGTLPYTSCTKKFQYKYIYQCTSIYMDAIELYAKTHHHIRKPLGLKRFGQTVIMRERISKTEGLNLPNGKIVEKSDPPSVW